MKKHTNLDHEITGEYYKRDWRDTVAITLATLAIFVVIAEFSGLTDWFISLWM